MVTAIFARVLRPGRITPLTLRLTSAKIFFDKSDESMLTDYEELLQQLGDSGGDLLNFINGLVDSFLTENPVSIKNEIYDIKKSIRHLEIELDYEDSRRGNNYKYIKSLEAKIDEQYIKLDNLYETNKVSKS